MLRNIKISSKLFKIPGKVELYIYNKRILDVSIDEFEKNEDYYLDYFETYIKRQNKFNLYINIENDIGGIYQFQFYTQKLIEIMDKKKKIEMEKNIEILINKKDEIYKHSILEKSKMHAIYKHSIMANLKKHSSNEYIIEGVGDFENIYFAMLDKKYNIVKEYIFVK